MPPIGSDDRGIALDKADALLNCTALTRAADQPLFDWLTYETGLAKLPSSLTQASRLDSDGFITAIRAALPKRAGITPTRLAQLLSAFADTAEPARAARAVALGDKRALSDVVNRAYGLTPEDVALM